jgi:GxxExxY protein
MVELKHSDITGEVIRAFYQVYNSLGFGFLEKVYGNALALELRQSGIDVVQQKPISVHYKGVVVGKYFADLLIEEIVLVGLKASSTLVGAHEAQLLNYLRATNIEVGLLLNFGEKPDHKRKLYTNDNKPLLSVLFDP